VTPRVSVCVPAYQAAAHLEETLDSVWGQDFADFELIVVDDGSTDATAAVLAAQTDPRLRVFRHARNRGQAVTVGEAVAHARGELVKFLDADDLLCGDCLGAMVAALDASPSAVFAFSRRELLVEAPDDEASRVWVSLLGELHVHFERLGELGDGRDLLRQYLGALLPSNWIAEPAGVMARRSDVIAVGGYNPRLRQNNDVDLWLRLMARGDVAFVDRPLYRYRLAYSGVTGGSAGERQWLDRLWIAEGLTQMDSFPEPAALRRCRRRLLVRAVRRVVQAPFAEPKRAMSRLADLASYACYRLAWRVGQAKPLHLPIAEPWQ
jgi:glycosyltransferase involved in cell wall biosynthesis